jgi:hypothetical protein
MNLSDEQRKAMSDRAKETFKFNARNEKTSENLDLN